MQINPREAPKAYGFGWNLGTRDQPKLLPANVTSLVQYDDVVKYSNIYFRDIHPVYGFVDTQEFRYLALKRWKSTETFSDFDPIFAGVTALGSLFSGSNCCSSEAELIKFSKSVLEAKTATDRPLPQHAVAWLLRTLYLRSSDCPHAAWISSCTTMHVIEATGVHQDPSTISLGYSDNIDSERDPECQRRLFWVARVLNTWISNEHGRSQVFLRGITCRLPLSKEGDLTLDLISLYQTSRCLEPEATGDFQDLERHLTSVEQYNFEHDALILSQSNLALVIYRRLRVTRASMPFEVINRVIRIGKLGLEAAIRMAKADQPWWHVVNVPFQFVCVLLAINTEEALACLGEATRTLKLICRHFDTAQTRKTLEVTTLLFRMSQKAKSQRLTLLKAGFDELQADVESPSSWNGGVQIMEQDSTWPVLGSWDSTWDYNLNWDDFFGADVPLFNNDIAASGSSN